MEQFKSMFKMAIKILLLLIGSVMLFGGGICVATNIFFALQNVFRQGVWLFLMLMSISGLIAWAGWGAIKLSGITQSLKSGNEDELPKDSDEN